MLGLVEGIGEERERADVERSHRRSARRGIAEIGAADVARLIASLLCHTAAAGPVDDIDFVVIRNRALAYHHSLTVF